MKLLPKKYHKIIYFLLYILISMPIIYCIYYSVPASDDFAAATRPNGGTLIEQCIRHGFGMWATWGGRWLSQFVQTLINPLNSHQHLGHKYGIYMIVVFIITTALIVYGLWYCVERVLGKKSKYISIVTFLIMAIFLSTYYYSECYNWYVGAMVYTIPFGFILLAIAAMIKYVDEERTSNLQYALIIIAGIFPATIEYCDVALGICYVYFIYYCHWKERMEESISLKIKNAVPLIIYIILGVSSVFAPGNKVRQEYYHLNLSVTKSFVQYIKDVVIRVQDLIVDHPLAVIIFLMLVFIGILSNDKHEKVSRIPETILLFVIITTGSLYPYIYGRAFETTYLDIRMEYVLDFCLHVGIGILCLMMGRYISYRLKLQLDSKDKLLIGFGLGIFVYVSLLQNYAYLNVVQIDILRNRGIIVESYNYWDSVLADIESSEDDVVVVERDYVPEWSRYFLAVGIESGDLYNADANKIYDEELIMPNVYYGKKSIQMKYKK